MTKTTPASTSSSVSCPFKTFWLGLLSMGAAAGCGPQLDATATSSGTASSTSEPTTSSQATDPDATGPDTTNPDATGPDTTGPDATDTAATDTAATDTAATCNPRGRPTCSS